MTIGVNYLIGIFWYTKSYKEWLDTDVKPRKITWVIIELFSIPAFAVYFVFARHYFIKNQKISIRLFDLEREMLQE